jgi:transcriptional regulator with XRE-family HTH domain
VEKKTVMESVRKLRDVLNLTQPQLAARLDCGMSTVQRWEQVVPPRGTALVQLMELADAHGQVDLARIFQEAISEEIGYPVPRISAERGYRPEGQELHDALESILYLGGRENEKDRDAVKKLLARAMKANSGKNTRAMTIMGLALEVERRVRAGESDEEIVAALPGANAEFIRVRTSTVRALQQGMQK